MYNSEHNKVRIIIITMGISRIVEPLVDNNEVIGIIECAPRKVKGNYLFFSFLKKLNSFFKKKKTLKFYCEKKKLPYYYMDKGSNKELEDWVKKMNPDVIFVYSMSQLLKPNIFTIPKYGTLNLHPSFLPKYRGPNPWFWTYYNFEEFGGVTLHYIDEGEDTGDIIYQEQYKIRLGLKSPEMQDLAIGEIGNSLISKAIENIASLPKSKQSEKSPIKRAKNIGVNEHKTIINWDSWEIERIWHVLRGTDLWLNALPTPIGIFKNQRWIVQGMERKKVSNYEEGKIYKEKNRFFLVCKEGVIYLSIKFSIKRFLLSFINTYE